MLTQTALPTWLANALALRPADNFSAQLKQLKDNCAEKLMRNGLPSSKNEAWKYTDLSRFIDQPFSIHHNQLIRNQVDDTAVAIVNGCLTGVTKHQDLVIYNLQSEQLHDSNLLHTYFNFNLDLPADLWFADLNTALANDVIVVYVPPDKKISETVKLQLRCDASHSLLQPHVIVVVGAGSQLTLIEEYAGQGHYWHNSLHKIYLQANATLNYYKLQNEHVDAIHTATAFIQQDEASHFYYVNVSNGSCFSRDTLMINLIGQNADCQTAGFYHLHATNHYVDHHVTIDHRAPHTQSTMLYKGIVDHKSRAVFNGRLHVAKHAQKISAHQANHHLLLSPHAEAYSKPELEIYADDVQCKHGATTGQLDEDALFYLRARGISDHEARKILLQSFATEVMQKIHDPNFKKLVERQNHVR